MEASHSCNNAPLSEFYFYEDNLVFSFDIPAQRSGLHHALSAFCRVGHR